MKISELLVETHLSDRKVKLSNGTVNIVCSASLGFAKTVEFQWIRFYVWRDTDSLHPDGPELTEEFELSDVYDTQEVRKLIKGLLKYFKKAGTVEAVEEFLEGAKEHDNFSMLAAKMIKEP